MSEDYVLSLVFESSKAFIAELYHREEQHGFQADRHIGIVVGYLQAADAEIFAGHWQVVCHVSGDHFSETLIDQIGPGLKKDGMCQGPLIVEVYAEDTDRRDGREYGKVLLEE